MDVIDKPFTRKEGDTPAWNDAEIDDVIEFLKTPTDCDVKPIDTTRSQEPADQN